MAISKDLEETSADVTETSRFVLTSILTAHFLTLLTGHFTYEERRRRESNPRIDSPSVQLSFIGREKDNSQQH